MKKHWLTWLSLVVILLASVVPVLAQDAEYVLEVHRNFGYGGGDQIRGSFSVSIYPPTNIRQVTFYIDTTVMAEIKTEPFKFDFETGAYSIGWHDLSAVVVTADGRSVTTPVRRFEFVSVEFEMKAVGNIMGIIFGSLGAILVVSLVFYLVFLRRKRLDKLPMGAPRRYGIYGGSVCPKCKRAFSRHWWALNVGLSKYDRCSFCGRWSMVRRASQPELEAAVAAELDGSQPEVPAAKTEEEKLKEMLDNSKFME